MSWKGGPAPKPEDAPGKPARAGAAGPERRVMLQHTRRGARHAANRARAASGIGRLQAGAVDAVVAEERHERNIARRWSRR